VWRCRGEGHRSGRHAVRVAGLVARHDFRPGDDVVAQGAAGVSRIWTYHPDVCGVPSSRELGQADLRDRTPGDRQTGGIMTVHAVRRAEVGCDDHGDTRDSVWTVGSGHRVAPGGRVRVATPGAAANR